MRSKRNSGIRIRHRRTCKSRDGDKCNCDPGFEAWAYSKRDGKKVRKTFARESEAKLWRADAMVQLSKGAMRAPKPTTVREAWATWYEGAKAGTIRRARNGERFKPSTLRTYEYAMRLRVLPDLGASRLADLQRPDVQAFADRLLADGLDASTIRVTLASLRALFRRAVSRGDLALNPCDGIELPAATGRRERFATPAEAEALIAAVPVEDRAAWATALYAGLRRGELQALKWEQIDLAAGIIRVERGWDAEDGEIELKSKAGRRRVPITPALRDHLIEQRLRGDRAEGFVFGPDADTPLDPRPMTDRADRAWKQAGLERITLHECRHTFASLMIAAGVNARALMTFMGHANISVTLDRYGHLMPGSEAEAAGLLDAYLNAERERAEEQARATAEVA